MATIAINPIEICSEVVNHEPCQESPLPVLRQKFRSRNADFVVATSKYRYLKNHEISLQVGPLGLNMRADEAQALGKALIAAAEHYSATGNAEVV